MAQITPSELEDDKGSRNEHLLPQFGTQEILLAGEGIERGDECHSPSLSPQPSSPPQTAQDISTLFCSLLSPPKMKSPSGSSDQQPCSPGNPTHDQAFSPHRRAGGGAEMAGSKVGKPPLAPQSTAAARHNSSNVSPLPLGRGGSSSEYSAMSELSNESTLNEESRTNSDGQYNKKTNGAGPGIQDNRTANDASLPPPAMLKRKDRTVSWDFNASCSNQTGFPAVYSDTEALNHKFANHLKTIVSESNLLQPNLHAFNPKDEAVSPSLTDAVAANSNYTSVSPHSALAAVPNYPPSQHRRTGSKAGSVGHVRKPTLTDQILTSPVESEAEAAIIRALEERDHIAALSHSPSNTPGAHYNILAGVPNEATLLFDGHPTLKNNFETAAPLNESMADNMPNIDRNSSEFRQPLVPPHVETSFSPSPTVKRAIPNVTQKSKHTTIKDMATQLRLLQKGTGVFGSSGEDISSGGGYLQRAAMHKSMRHIEEMGKSSKSFNTTHTDNRSHGMDISRHSQRTSKIRKPDPVCSADVLFNNADKLFRDRKKTEDFDIEAQQQPSHARVDSGSQRPTNPAKKNWRKVRMSVTTASAIKSGKNYNHNLDNSLGHASRVSSLGGGDVNNDEKLAGEDDQFNKKADFGTEASSGRKRKKARAVSVYKRRLNRELEVFKEVLGPKVFYLRMYLKFVLVSTFVPVLGVAALLFYVFDNPIISDTSGSYSWWLIFLGVRQVITFTLSKIFEIVFIDVLSLRTRFILRIWGSLVTLMIVQSRGWPYTITFWAIWNFAILFGSRAFPNHWLFWQNRIGLFNEQNPGGDVLSSDIYMRILAAAIVAGCVTAFKRVVLASYLGKKTYENYGQQLEKVMRKMILLTEVAHLAQEIYEANEDEEELIGEEVANTAAKSVDFRALRKASVQCGDDDGDALSDDGSATTERKSTSSSNSVTDTPHIEAKRSKTNTEVLTRETSGQSTRSLASIDAASCRSTRPGITAGFSNASRPSLAEQTLLDTSDRMKIRNMIGDWEEPEMRTIRSFIEKTTINDVLQFRQAVTYMDDKYPFSIAFGPAKTRDDCIESSHSVFERLLLHTPGRLILPFETVCLIAIDRDGCVNEEKIKSLIRLLRPDRHGNLTLLDFVKSCDSVYKNVRMFRAAVANSGQIDNAFESIINVVFFFLLAMTVLTICNLNPWTLILSLSGLIVSFAFMFSSAASKYFEGILFILARRPYDIGDRINVSGVDKDSSADGAAGWFVENVTLFTTTVRYATTNEVATVSNGSLAACRIINGRRSPKGTVYISLKISVDVPYQKVQIMKSAVETFVKARPREWLALNGFRSTRVEADLGFIEYVICLSHVEAWQNIVPILQSKADLASYCLELSKQLGIRYQAPPLPVNLALADPRLNSSVLEEMGVSFGERNDNQSKASDQINFSTVSDLFAKPEDKKKN